LRCRATCFVAVIGQQPGQSARPDQAVECIVPVVHHLAGHHIHNAGDIADLIVSIAQVLLCGARLGQEILLITFFNQFS
jgi:hypothetical protein